MRPRQMPRDRNLGDKTIAYNPTEPLTCLPSETNMLRQNKTNYNKNNIATTDKRGEQHLKQLTRTSVTNFCISPFFQKSL